jgi:hypothetical protein
MQTTPIYDNHTLRIQFGDICYALACHDTDIFDSLKELFNVFRSERPADINIKLNIVDRLDRAQVESILSQMEIARQGNNYITPNKAFGIAFNAARNTFTVTADRLIFDPSLKLKPFNRLFSIAYFTTSWLRHLSRPTAMLVHSCGILRNGQVLLFAGPSETGKSTIGRLCSEDYGVTLNDEMVLLSWPQPHNHGLWVHSIPIVGEVPFRLNTSAPLAGVLMLKQSKRTAVRRISRKEAYLRFLYQIINPSYFNQNDRRAAFSMITEFVDEVTKATPFYELEFALDKNLLWEVEASIAELKGKEERDDRKLPQAS